MFKQLIDIEKIANEVSTNGYAVVYNALTEKVIEGLNNEFDMVFESSLPNVKPGTNPAGKHARINRNRLNSDSLPVISELFNDKVFNRLIKACSNLDLDNEPDETIIHFSHAFYSEQITDIHFDMYQHLKFFFYLTDTDQTNGAISFASNSQQENNSYRQQFLRQKGELKRLLNIIPASSDLELVPINGPAGTMIVFDTDTFHQGGKVQPGKERRVIRFGSKYPGQPLQARHNKLSLNWLLSRLNPPDLPSTYPGRTSTGGSARNTEKAGNY